MEKLLRTRKILRKFVLKSLESRIQIAELSLCLRTSALQLLHRIHHAAHDGREVLHIEPEWQDDEYRPHNELKKAAEPRIPPHRMEHAVVLFDEL